jgi:hypothetical protein
MVALEVAALVEQEATAAQLLQAQVAEDPLHQYQDQQ